MRKKIRRRKHAFLQLVRMKKEGGTTEGEKFLIFLIALRECVQKGEIFCVSKVRQT